MGDFPSTMVKILKLIPITLFILFSSLTSITYAETLKFAAATYEGEVKKGKANGNGTLTFSDGSTISHMSNHDMRIPIAHALSWPKRFELKIKSKVENILNNLTLIIIT